MKFTQNTKYFVPALLLVFFGCQDIEYPEKPENLIPEEKMVDVLVDIHLLNSARAYDRNTLQENGITSDFVYNKYGIDSLQVVQSNTYYGADLKTYGAIYKEVETRLRAQKKEVDTLMLRQEKSLDSVKQALDSLRLLKIDTLSTGIKTLRDSREPDVPAAN